MSCKLSYLAFIILLHPSKGIRANIEKVPVRGKTNGIVGQMRTTSFPGEKKDPGNENDESSEPGDV